MVESETAGSPESSFANDCSDIPKPALCLLAECSSPGRRGDGRDFAVPAAGIQCTDRFSFPGLQPRLRRQIRFAAHHRYRLSRGVRDGPAQPRLSGGAEK